MKERARCSASRVGTPRKSRPRRTLSSTLRHGSKASCWKRYAAWRLMPRSSSPSTRTLPSGGASSPAATLSKVDLPQPDGPTSATKVPAAMLSEMSLTTVCAPPAGVAKRTLTPANSTAGAMAGRSPGATRLLADAQLGIRLLGEGVAVGLGQVDMRGRHFRRRLAEHGEHRLGALGVHPAGRRVHRDRVLEGGEVERLVTADHVGRHLGHDLLGAVAMDPFERADDGVGQRLRLLGMLADPRALGVERAARILAAEHRLGIGDGARVGKD